MDQHGFLKRARRKRPLHAQDNADELSSRRNDNSTRSEKSPQHALGRSDGVPDPLQIHTDLLMGIDDTEDSPSKHKSPRFFTAILGETFRPKWRKTVLICLMLRCLWYLGMLHTRVLTSLGQDTNTSTTQFLRVKPSDRSDDLLHDQNYALTYQQRRNRITPNLQLTDGSIVNGNVISLPTITMSLNTTDYNWRELCHEAGLDTKSRVVITNPFSLDSPASAFAMLIHHQCQVTDIRLVDPMLPEELSSRARVTRQYLAPLHKSIPNLHPVEIPSVGKSRNWFVHQRYDKHVTLPAPTHVIHFPAVIFDTGNQLDNLLSESNARLLLYRTATLQMEEFLARVILQPLSSKVSYLQVSYPDAISNQHQEIFGLSQQLSSVLFGYSTSIRKIASRNQLQLLPTFGPGVLATSNTSSAASLYVEDALAAILIALRPTKQPVQYALPRSVEVSSKLVPNLQWLQKRSRKLNVNSTRLFQSLIWLSKDDDHLQKPPNLDANTAKQLDSAALRNSYFFGVSEPSFPCISSCGNPYFSSRCQPSIWDDIVPLSRRATSNCSHVAYQVDLDQQLESLPEIPIRIPQLCRLAFVSVSAPIVNTAIQQAMQDGTEGTKETNLSWNEILRDMNGMLDYSGWTLIWLSPPDMQLSKGDNAITMIDPKGLFADRIEKVMYVGSPTLANTSDGALHQIMKTSDRRSSTGDKVKEFRRGVSGFRWIETEPYRARKTVFFVGGASPQFTPKNVSDFADMVSASVKLPDPQISFYEQVVELSRHEDENSMRTMEFQFEWVALSVFVHDLKSKEAQAFRCEWFDEYLSWGDNRNAEELSLAYLLGLKRIEGLLGPELDKSWFPFMDRNRDPLLTSQDEEVFCGF